METSRSPLFLVQSAKIGGLFADYFITVSISNGQRLTTSVRVGESARLPVEMDAAQQHRCLSSRDALDAVIAARCAAVAVLSGEVDRTPENLAPGEGDRGRREGWIYGIEDPTF